MGSVGSGRVSARASHGELWKRPACSAFAESRRLCGSAETRTAYHDAGPRRDRSWSVRSSARNADRATGLWTAPAEATCGGSDDGARCPQPIASSTRRQG
jgi:hypothetical protein